MERIFNFPRAPGCVIQEMEARVLRHWTEDEP